MAEVTRVLLYEKWQDRGRYLLPRDDYRRFASLINAMIDQLDYRYELHRVSHITPTDEEQEWARARDPDDMHLQLLARASNADYVVSLNTRDFPNPSMRGEYTRGSLADVVWIHPGDLIRAFGI